MSNLLKRKLIKETDNRNTSFQMDEEKIKELKSKKQQLPKEAHIKNLRKRIDTQISHLEKLEQNYFAFYDFENINWIDSNVLLRKRDGYIGIHEDFQIDVDDTTAISSCKISKDEINSEKFKELFSTLISSESSLIVCYQGGDPELEISAKAFLDKPTEFLSRPEVWMLTTNKKWLIEYISDQNAIRFIQLNESRPTLVMKIIIEEN